MTAGRKPLRWAMLAVLPYLVLGLIWVFTNPPDGAPDEHDHLIKALGAGQFDIGVPFAGQPPDDSPAATRNASISRTVTIPVQLFPGGFDCLAFHPERTADCLPRTVSTDDGTIQATATVGAYPVFFYIPIGMAALLADSPWQAFQLGRLVSLLMSTALLLLAAWQLARWLGRGALLGIAVAITPVALFASATVSTSGVEIMSAIGVASVAVIVSRRPEALADRATLTVLGISAVSLLLSRQLGVATLALAAVVALSRGGGPVVWRELRKGRPALIVTIAAVALAAVTILWWELNFDHPAVTATVASSLSADSWGNFIDMSFNIVRLGIGVFGWADTALPGLVIAMWILLVVAVVGAACFLGSRADAWTLVLSFLYVCVVGYVIQATVFAPIASGIQGRHLIPAFVIVPILAGVVLSEHFAGPATVRARRRLFLFVGVIVGFVQGFSIMFNARRYAVGWDGSVWFLPHALWAPRFGWLPWLLLTLVAAVGLGVVIVLSGRQGEVRADPAVDPVDETELPAGPPGGDEPGGDEPGGDEPDAVAAVSRGASG